MDPNDSANEDEESRVLRSKYNEMIQITEENRSEFLQAESSSLYDTLTAANELFSHVKSTHEAQLDAKLLLQTSSLTSQRAQKVKLEQGSWDLTEFLNAVAKLTETGANTSLDSLHDHAANASSAPPAMAFM
jgi:hypothetical protein